MLFFHSHSHATERLLEQALSRLSHGTLTVTTPEGRTRSYGTGDAPFASIVLHDWSVIRNLALRGDVGFADDYRKGRWDSDDLTALIALALENAEVLDGFINGGALARVIAAVTCLARLNTRSGSRRNIHAHYDLGNDFYRLWLDPTMTYSSALYADPSESLESAQHRKYDRILDRLGDSGDVVEIGCGWGGFAERAVGRDHRVTGVTISDEQHDYAIERLAKTGGQGRIVKKDYRMLEGVYDRAVSIEMFEAVGERFWPGYFRKLGSLLKPGGNAMLQTIVIRDDLFDTYRRTGDAIRTFIFPGGMLPSETRFRASAAANGMRVTDTFRFGQDYARTMRAWLASFEARLHDVRALGFDEPFIRLWRYYLCACIAGFAVDRFDVMQADLRHA